MEQSFLDGMVCEFRSPLPDIVELQIVNKDVPCGEDFDHFTRVGFFISNI